MRCMCKYFQCRSLIPRFSCVASLQVTLPLTHLLRLPSGCHNIGILNRLCQASIGQSGILILIIFCLYICLLQVVDTPEQVMLQHSSSREHICTAAATSARPIDLEYKCLPSASNQSGKTCKKILHPFRAGAVVGFWVGWAAKDFLAPQPKLANRWGVNSRACFLACSLSSYRQS